MTRPDMSPVIPAMGGAAERVRRIGSLCTGYGGLDAAVQEVLGGEIAWMADNDPGACKILDCRQPGVRNIGDITVADWLDVEPVDLVCGGYPCQPDSDAGPRRGIEDERFIWPSIAAALRVLQPSAVVFENVPGHLGRGFPHVLADLARLGYQVRWVTIRASDVGAPHKRARVFIYGWLAQPAAQPATQVIGVLDGTAWRKPQDSLFGAVPLTKMPPAGYLADGLIWACDPYEPVTTPPAQLLPTPAAGCFNDGESLESWQARNDRLRALGVNGNGMGTPLAIAVQRLLPTPAARDWKSGQSNILDRNARPLNEVIENLPLLKTPTAQLAVNGGSQDPAKRRAGGHGPTLADQIENLPAVDAGIDWREYGPAVQRWEHLAGPAPAPTAPGRGGKPRLAPSFAEWMMDLPAGHVTGIPGLTRKEQLRALGNGVVRRQAALALRLLPGAPEILDMAA